jgi:hypothetical protein
MTDDLTAGLEGMAKAARATLQQIDQYQRQVREGADMTRGDCLVALDLCADMLRKTIRLTVQFEHVSATARANEQLARAAVSLNAVALDELGKANYVTATAVGLVPADPRKRQ